MDFPFDCRETPRLDAQAKALFVRTFGAAAPEDGRHFVSWLQREGHEPKVAGYIHYTPFSPGVFLCGGLCVDSSLYRLLSREQRDAVAQRGSLARWLTDTSISMLGKKRAVFAYTGNIRSRRDGFAIGSVPAGKHLIVQWHDEPESAREQLIDRVSALGPF